MSPASRAINLWSGPRNVSTALMYSFARLEDVRVVDEPLYGHYLAQSGAPHPGRDEVLDAMETDGGIVMEALLALQRRCNRRLFLKQMAHHLVGLDSGFLGDMDNVLLVRDPADMLPSLRIQVPQATLTDTGLKRQWQLYEQLRGLGQRPVVVDARELLLDPPGILEQLCARLGLRFDPAMLSWPAGPREEDGVWARHWYHAVHSSTGFEPYRPKTDFPASLEGLLEECRPWYDRLQAVALRAE